MPSAVIVGAGIFGISIADHLAGAGFEVTVVDQEDPGHPRQASAGESRLLRFSHGTDSWYAALAWRARELWRELERQTGASLLVETGVVWFARTEGDWEDHSLAVLAGLDIPAHRVEPADIGRWFPDVATADLRFGVHEPHGGLVRARQATLVLAARAQARGARLIRGRATPYGSAVEVGGSVLRADRVVWACGGWLPYLFPDLVIARTTKQDVVHVGVGPGWASPPVPAWLDYAAAVYGCGDLEGTGMKVCSDEDGPPFEPQHGDREVSPGYEDVIRDYLRHRFPSIAGAPVTLRQVCQYAIMPDGEWLIARHPEHPRVWLVGGDSGHGFKHGPAFGEYVARLVCEVEEPHPRFGLGPRPATRGLRTRRTDVPGSGES